MSRAFGVQVPNEIIAGEGPWFVQIWGVGTRISFDADSAKTLKIRNSYTWQDLKDHVRPAAFHVGHVAVYANGRATITVRKQDEAVRCFGKDNL